MNRRLSCVEIQQHAEVAKRLQEITERLLPNIRGLQTVTERARKEAEDLREIGKRLIRFDEALQPEAGFAPYWSHVADSQVFAESLETEVQRLQSFVQGLQSDAKGLQTIDEDLRHIQQSMPSE